MNNKEPALIIISGEYKSSVIVFHLNEEIILGRDPGVSTLVFSSQNISRKHCSVQYNSNIKRFRVTNFSSTGTIINGTRKMYQGETDYFNNGDTISLGGTDNVFRLYVPQEREVNDDTDMLMEATDIIQNIENEGNIYEDISSPMPKSPQKNPIFSILGCCFGGGSLLIAAIFWMFALTSDNLARTCFNIYYDNGTLIYLLILCAVAGTVLSIIGLATENRKAKTCGIVGTIISIVCVLLLVMIIITAGSYTPEKAVEDILDSWFN